MTIQPTDHDPDTQPIEKIGTGERKRAALVLGVIAVVAVLVVGIMVYAFGTSNNSSDQQSPAAIPSGPAVTVTGGVSSTKSTPKTRTKTKPKPAATKSTGPRTGPVSCPTSSPCALPDDIGDALGALNAYRTAHKLPGVTGSVTKAAQTCAVHNGDGASCPSGYFWEPVGRSGTEVIDKIAAQRDGTGWLLDKNLKTVGVGWAYIPSSKSFECVLVSPSS